jgi:ATP-dependent Clp protease ATP-binding subunit ClpA
MLQGRHRERELLEWQLERARRGQSAVRSEAGIGKTALLDHVAERASECQVARAAGVHGALRACCSSGTAVATRTAR